MTRTVGHGNDLNGLQPLQDLVSRRPNVAIMLRTSEKIDGQPRNVREMKREGASDALKRRLESQTLIP